MPIYEAECMVCGKRYEWYTSNVTDETRDCPECLGPGARLYSWCAGKVFQPFTTRNIMRDGSPVTITSHEQHVRLCHENGVVPVDMDQELKPTAPSWDKLYKDTFKPREPIEVRSASNG